MKSLLIIIFLAVLFVLFKEEAYMNLLIILGITIMLYIVIRRLAS